MAIDEVQVQQETTPPAGPNHSGTFIAVFVVLAGLAVGEIYSLSQISSMRGSVESTVAQSQKDQQEMLSRFSRRVPSAWDRPGASFARLGPWPPTSRAGRSSRQKP